MAPNKSLSKTDVLRTAKLTAFWMQSMADITASHPTQDDEFNRELERLLSSCAGAILRWRIVTGEKAGLLKVVKVSDWERDEFD